MRHRVLAVGILVMIAGFVFAGCSLLRIAPSVDFDASPTEGRAPLAVQFTPQVEGTPISYAWDFGDGRTSDAPNPVHVYTDEGTYSVMLTVEFAPQETVTLIKKRLMSVAEPLRRATPSYLYWISESYIKRGSIGGGGSERLLANWVPPSGMDVAGGKIYWVTTTSTGGTLESADLDGSNRQTLVREENRLSSVAVDVEHGKVYWTSLPESPRVEFEPNKTWDGALKCANLDGSDVEVLVEYPAGAGAYADQVVVGTEGGGVVLWSLIGDGVKNVIQMSLTSPFEFEATDWIENVGHPQRLALNEGPGVSADYLYYTTGDELRRANLWWWGSKATVLTGLDSPTGVAVDPIDYYIYVGTGEGILRVVTDGTGLETLFPNETQIGCVILPR